LLTEFWQSYKAWFITGVDFTSIKVKECLERYK